MRLYEFLLLEDTQQYQAVWDQGVHVDDVIYEGLHYQLYAIGDFYVEIHYDAQSNNIVGKLPFRQGEPLEKYLGRTPLI